MVQIEFYKLASLEYENATGYLEAIKTELVNDNLWDLMPEHLIGLVTDGASVLVGETSGLGVIMRDALGREYLYTHHCLNHRFNDCDLFSYF